MKILILEDEIPAYEKLLSHIENELPDTKVLGWGRSLAEAEHFVKKHKDSIDVIFSDIQLLDGLSFDVFEKYDVSCPIIFCTAFDTYLLKAFQSNGIAYILKPYDALQFNEAIEKYRSLFGGGESNVEKDTLTELKNILLVDKPEYKKRFSIKKKGGIKLLSIDNISFFEASGDFCLAYDSSGGKHIVNYSLGDIESKVDPKLFFRINRSEILGIDHIENIEPYFKNRLSIKIKQLSELKHTSSAKTKAFRSWLEGN